MDDAADAELVACIAGGGERAGAAEDTLCRRYAVRIRLYGLKHLRAEEAARDLVQTVLLGVLEAARAGRIDEPSRLDRFVLGTCRNAASRARQQTARTPLASDEALAALAIAPVEPLDLGRVYTCLGSLDSRARLVLMMSYLEERSAEEIGERLSLRAGNVRVARHRALAALRRCVDDGARAEV